MGIADLFRVDGRLVIVTGAARGIGAACADLIAEGGATVVRVDVLSGEGGRGCDVGDRAAVDLMVDETLAEHGRLDAIVNVAAIIRDGGVVDLPERDLDEVLRVNLKGTLFCCQAALRHLRPGGAIVNMASGGGVLPVPSVAAYGMSKAAVISLTRSLAAEVGARGIRVNAIAPGVTVTPMTTRHIDATDPAAVDRFRERAAEANPMREAVTPEDIAATALYLVADASRHVTGQVLYVNAGVIMSS